MFKRLWKFVYPNSKIKSRAYLWKNSEWVTCDCSVHDITVRGAAHAVDCPMFDS